MRSYEVEEGVWVAGETKLRVAGEIRLRVVGETGTVKLTSENSMLLAITIFELSSGQTSEKKIRITGWISGRIIESDSNLKQIVSY